MAWARTPGYTYRQTIGRLTEVLKHPKSNYFLVFSQTTKLHLKYFVPGVGVNAEEESRKTISQPVKHLVLVSLSAGLKDLHESPPEKVVNYSYRRLGKKYFLPKFSKASLKYIEIYLRIANICTSSNLKYVYSLQCVIHVSVVTLSLTQNQPGLVFIITLEYINNS